MRWILLMGIMISTHSSASAQEIAIPGDYVWKNRIILLFAPAKDSFLLQQQDAELQADTKGIQERDLLIFQVLPDQVLGQQNLQDARVAQSLRDQYRIEPEKFYAILIGKDGSEKLRKDTVMTREELYGTIDAMPMRRRKMREGKGN